jgi:RNA polymerase sigma factor for flagellar operon FliA
MVNFEDLVSIGVIGLIAAVDHYDPSHGVRLHTYADYKIRGAILDNLRTSDGVAARQRRAAKQLRAAIAAVEQRLCRKVDEDEAADELGVSLEEYRKAVEKTTPVYLRSLDAYSYVGDRLVRLRDTIADKEEMQPSWGLEQAELRDLVRSGVASLPQNQQRVIRDHFFQGQPLRQIAVTLGVHVTRVSQLKIQAVEKLRAYVLERLSTKKDGTRNDAQAGKHSRSLVAC